MELLFEIELWLLKEYRAERDDKLWQCFLRSYDTAPSTFELSRIDRMGMDSAKLHCCSKAVGSSCRRLCVKTFSNEWTRSWDDFDRECLSQLSEDTLYHCIDEDQLQSLIQESEEAAEHTEEMSAPVDNLAALIEELGINIVDEDNISAPVEEPEPELAVLRTCGSDERFGGPNIQSGMRTQALQMLQQRRCYGYHPRSGFYQILASKDSKRFLGVYYIGKKFAFTRIPMGHDLSPATLQRITTEAFRALTQAVPQIQGIIYLNDLLFHSREPHILEEVPGLLEKMNAMLWMVTAYSPELRRMIVVKNFSEALEINTAEMLAGIMGVRWTHRELQPPVIIIVEVDNTKMLHGLLSGQGLVFNNTALYRLHLWVMEIVRDCQLDIFWVLSSKSGGHSLKSGASNGPQNEPRRLWNSETIHIPGCLSASAMVKIIEALYVSEYDQPTMRLFGLNSCVVNIYLHVAKLVEEPCELGCDGLSYCTNFNNRPTELFRSCTRQADDAARFDTALWQQEGYLGLPGLNLPVRNISKCSPNVWKAVACALQIKPCHRHSHANRICRYGTHTPTTYAGMALIHQQHMQVWHLHANNICREDCLDLLSECLDWTRMSGGHTAVSLCLRLSPDHPDTPCISLKQFLQPSDSPYFPPHKGVTSPCKGAPCNSSEVCLINRRCSPGSSCLPYTCVPGCKLGEVSQYIVPEGSYVRIPAMTSGMKSCLKICQCSANGVIEHCQPMPCYPLNSCLIGSRKIEHGTTFHIDCKLGSCYAGELSYSKKQCEMSSLGGHDDAYTSLPCNCRPHYVPVCGRNGNTYPSACLARCADLKDSDFEYHPCSAINPCENNPCGEGKTCHLARKVCLSLLKNIPCRQYECVDNSVSCSSTAHAPVCDTEGKEHPNMCYLVRYGKTLAYRGPCLVNCESKGTVCGINGETYTSECAAFAARVSVDYSGPCMALGLIGDQAVPQCGDVIVCPPLLRPGCLGVTPPGACCPICGGALRFLYSQKQVDRALYILRGNTLSALTVHAVLTALERQVQVAECAVRGYLTVETDLFVLVQPVGSTRPPSDVQLEACIREAEKLANLVRGSSPRVLTIIHTSEVFARIKCNSSNITSLQITITLSYPLDGRYFTDGDFITVTPSDWISKVSVIEISVMGAYRYSHQTATAEHSSMNSMTMTDKISVGVW
uniref:Reversion-inducing cysteine-rich protein with Kazal motifs n=1 Tax=Timema tahoe TaxID=61484 RepID=A0A7R9FM01_9NEOP|nr:unnamed protein product [Timema tahoe]